jgi:uncharacterized protein
MFHKFRLLTASIIVHLLFHMMKSATALGRTNGVGGRGAAAASVGIKMILSPAKTLDLSPPWPKPNNNVDNVDEDAEDDTYCNHCMLQSRTTRPDCNIEKTRLIAMAMKRYQQSSELAKLLGVSANIATTALQYWNDFQLPLSPLEVEKEDEKKEDNDNNNSKPCIFAFSGAAYQGLHISTCSNEAILYLQDNLRIIDPVYGALRPLDRIQPYRLEMATKGLVVVDDSDYNDNDTVTTTNGGATKLASYWKDAVTARLKEELVLHQGASGSANDNSHGANNEHSPVVVFFLNLASDEYAAAVSAQDLTTKDTSVRYIKVIFREQGRVLAVHAKRARGLMVRYLAERQATTLDQVMAFDVEGYRLVEQHSHDDDDDDTLIFDRVKQPAVKGGAVATKKKAVATKAASPRAKRSKR